MPELPEVEVLVRHLAPRLAGKWIRRVNVLDPRSIRAPAPAPFRRALTNARFQSVQRRGKYLVCKMQKHRRAFSLLMHLGMTGRLYLTRRRESPTNHARVVFGLGQEQLVLEDMRRFGRMTLDPSAILRLGPEPLETGFTVDALSRALAGSRQAIKVRLLDQSVVAGIGNIYSCEALFLARIDPRTPSRNLDTPTLRRLRAAIRRVLSRAIRLGSTMPLNFGTPDPISNQFYFGHSPEHRTDQAERFQVYDREGQSCRRCKSSVRRIVQAGRSTFFCPECQT